MVCVPSALPSAPILGTKFSSPKSSSSSNVRVFDTWTSGAIPFSNGQVPSFGSGGIANGVGDAFFFEYLQICASRKKLSRWPNRTTHPTMKLFNFIMIFFASLSKM